MLDETLTCTQEHKSLLEVKKSEVNYW